MRGAFRASSAYGTTGQSAAHTGAAASTIANVRDSDDTTTATLPLDIPRTSECLLRQAEAR